MAEKIIKSETLINYLELEAKADALKAKADEAKRRFDAVKLDLWEDLKDAPDTHIERDLGPPWGVRRFTPGETIYANIYNEAEYLKYLKSSGLERELVGTAFRKAPLNVRVRRALKNPSVEMPPGVEHASTKYITAKTVKTKN